MSDRKQATDAMRAEFDAWLDTPVAAGEDPAPWIGHLAEEAAWQAWRHQAVKIERLRSSADWLMQCLQLVEMYGREALNKESQDGSIDWREFAVAMFSNAVKWRSGPAWCITKTLVRGDEDART